MPTISPTGLRDEYSVAPPLNAQITPEPPNSDPATPGREPTTPPPGPEEAPPPEGDPPPVSPPESPPEGDPPAHPNPMSVGGRVTPFAVSVASGGLGRPACISAVLPRRATFSASQGGCP